jgi:hypothetical protein
MAPLKNNRLRPVQKHVLAYEENENNAKYIITWIRYMLEQD